MLIEVTKKERDARIDSEIFSFSPDGMVFGAPIEIGIRIPAYTITAESRKYARLLTRQGDFWRTVQDSTLDEAGFVVGKTSHFSDYGSSLLWPPFSMSSGDFVENNGISLRTNVSGRLFLHGQSEFAVAVIAVDSFASAELTGFRPSHQYFLFRGGYSNGSQVISTESGSINVDVYPGTNKLLVQERHSTFIISESDPQTSCQGIFAELAPGMERHAVFNGSVSPAECRLPPTTDGYMIKQAISIQAPGLALICDDDTTLSGAHLEVDQSRLIGVLIENGATGSQVENCDIRGFSIGISALGAGQVIKDNTVSEPYYSQGPWPNPVGIMVPAYGGFRPSETRVSGNTINGLFSGISVFASTRASVFGNTVTDMVATGIGVAFFPQENDTSGLSVLNNTITRANTGLVVFPPRVFVGNNTVRQAVPSVRIEVEAAIDFYGLSVDEYLTFVSHNNFLSPQPTTDRAAEITYRLDPVGIPFELSEESEGNYWGTTAHPLFVPGLTSNYVGLVDSFPYCQQDDWVAHVGETPGVPFDCDQDGVTDDLPPVLRFNKMLPIGNCGTEYTIDATATKDDRNSLDELYFRLFVDDVEQDSGGAILHFTLSSVGLYTVLVTVEDTSGNIVSDSTFVAIEKLVPQIESMVPTHVYYGGERYEEITIIGRNFAVAGVNYRENAQIIFETGTGRPRPEQFLERNETEIRFTIDMLAEDEGRYLLFVRNPDDACGGDSTGETFVISRTTRNPRTTVTSVKPREVFAGQAVTEFVVYAVNATSLDSVCFRPVGNLASCQEWPMYVQSYVPQIQAFFLSGLPEGMIGPAGTYYASVNGSLPQSDAEKAAASFVVHDRGPSFGIASFPDAYYIRDQKMFIGQINHFSPQYSHSVAAWIGSSDFFHARASFLDLGEEPVYLNNESIPGQFWWILGLTIDTNNVGEPFYLGRFGGDNATYMTVLDRPTELDTEVIVIPVTLHYLWTPQGPHSDFTNDPEVAREVVDATTAFSSHQAECRFCDREGRTRATQNWRVTNGSTADQVWGDFYPLEAADNSVSNEYGWAVWNNGNPRCKIVFRFLSVGMLHVPQEYGALVRTEDPSLDEARIFDLVNTPNAIDVIVVRAFSGPESGTTDCPLWLLGKCNTKLMFHQSEFGLPNPENLTRPANIAARRGLSHEIGHVLLGRGHPSGLDGDGNADIIQQLNIMFAPGRTSAPVLYNATEQHSALLVTPDQCNLARMRAKEIVGQ